MSFTRKSARERQLDHREEVGFVVLTCPNCGLRGVRHWVPDSLDEYGLIVHGYFTCESGDTA